MSRDVGKEPAPFTRILLKGKGKGDDGGRRGGGAATPITPENSANRNI